MIRNLKIFPYLDSLQMALVVLLNLIFLEGRLLMVELDLFEVGRKVPFLPKQLLFHMRKGPLHDLLAVLQIPLLHVLDT